MGCIHLEAGPMLLMLGIPSLQYWLRPSNLLLRQQSELYAYLHACVLDMDQGGVGCFIW